MSTNKILNDLTAATVKVGDRIKTNKGGDCKVVRINSGGYYTVEFIDKYMHQMDTRMSSIRTGNILNPYVPSTCNKGYIGSGKYSTKESGRSSLIYCRWKYIVNHCYGETPNATMCDEWLNFQVFAEWFDRNTPDTCVTNNLRLVCSLNMTSARHYSPTTAHIIPVAIANLVIRKNSSTSANLVGVMLVKNRHKTRYSVVASTVSGRKYIGTYDTHDCASEVYQRVTEQCVRDLAFANRDWLTQLTFEKLRVWKYN